MPKAEPLAECLRYRRNTGLTRLSHPQLEIFLNSRINIIDLKAMACISLDQQLAARVPQLDQPVAATREAVVAVRFFSGLNFRSWPALK